MSQDRKRSVAEQFRRQAVSELVTSAGASAGRRMAKRVEPWNRGKAALTVSAAGVAAGLAVANDEANQALHYLAANIAQALRRPD